MIDGKLIKIAVGIDGRIWGIGIDKKICTR
jgi:hypothetical protein